MSVPTVAAAPLAPQDQVAFLARDFEQSYADKRRLTDQTWDACKFTFTTHSVIVAAAIATYRLAESGGPDLTSAARWLLLLGLLGGLFVLALMRRTRVYFVVVCRYVNEQRALFLAGHPLGFANNTGLFADASYPPYYHRDSTQMWAMFLVALLNAAVMGVLTFLVLEWSVVREAAGVALAAAIFVGQVAWVRRYLRSREGKTPIAALWAQVSQSDGSRREVPTALLFHLMRKTARRSAAFQSGVTR